MRAASCIALVLCVLVCLCAHACKPPFELRSGFCIFARRSPQLNWTDAYNFCRSIGGRLAITYDLIKNIRSIIDLSGSPATWTGINDRRNERDTARDNWQLGLGDDVLPLDNELWKTGKPDGGGRDCVVITSAGEKLNDRVCSNTKGQLCEMPPSSAAKWQQLQLSAVSRWNVTEIKGDVSRLECGAMATSLHNCLRFVHSSRYRRCLLAHCYQHEAVEIEIGNDEWHAYEISIED